MWAIKKDPTFSVQEEGRIYENKCDAGKWILCIYRTYSTRGSVINVTQVSGFFAFTVPIRLAEVSLAIPFDGVAYLKTGKMRIFMKNLRRWKSKLSR